jgi:hypothetical protein
MLAEDLCVLHEGVPTRRHLAAAFWESDNNGGMAMAIEV